MVVAEVIGRAHCCGVVDSLLCLLVRAAESVPVSRNPATPGGEARLPPGV
jgi:hypothetical protein